ncbi:Hint domain-containing protein [Amylibacter sp. IMCC11727]|uniref:Hint domain-containing protein n=1 Tax=Amylibacter sp. IMCC11727 TaxID=3039851 RepID=UPI00244D9EB9|nr:Hint domain-containing protein [Amylibacter sp. IMCC11727]WGI23171.1 Hint domain-containing protein [Amylibacter sp. IMCC11727]
MSDALGWVFTTPVSPGDTIDWLPTVNSRNPPHNEDFSWGEVSYSDIVPCFARGTHILTPGGDVLVENLRVGSRVETLDHGPQTVRWIGSAKRSARGACAPVRIRAGALENDRDLWVSQQHRMVLRGAKAELMFGEHEVFVPAKSLVNDCSVRIIEGGAVEYFHILFDNHEIIYAEGAMAESLHLGKQSFDALSYASRQEIKMLFPELDRAGTQLPQTARQVLRNYEVQALLHAV